MTTNGAGPAPMANGTANADSTPPSSMEINKSLRFCALFGGQGYDYMEELQSTYQKHLESRANTDSLVVRLVQRLSEALPQEVAVFEREQDALEAQNAASTSEQTPWRFRYGLDPASWCSDALPPAWYLQSAPVSYPLIFLAQLVNYVAALENSAVLGSKHEAILKKKLVSAMGHSQGVMSAVVLASAKDNEDFLDVAEKYSKLMFWLGVRCQQILNVRLSKEARAEGFATPMLAIEGLTEKQVAEVITKAEKVIRVNEQALKVQQEKQQAWFNRSGFVSKDPAQEKKSSGRRLFVSLINGPTSIVVSGSPRGLEILQEKMQETTVLPGKDDSERPKPHSSRKPTASSTFLRVSAPFHCPMNTSAVEKILCDLSEREPSLLSKEASDLAIPVYSTLDGSDLSKMSEDAMEAGDLLGVPQHTYFVRRLLEMQALDRMDLLKMIGSVHDVTHVLEFGPTGNSVIGATARMVGSQIEGSGIEVIAIRPTRFQELEEDIDESSVLPAVAQSQHLFSDGAVNWSDLYSPKLMKRKSDGMIMLDTKFSRFIGKPPIMMSGMTPTTSFFGIDLVAACANAGFQGELGGGGLPTPELTEAKIEELASKQEPGVGININMLYLNARMWAFQFPLVCEMRRRGVPIESITIGAGVPSPDKAEEIVSGLMAVGIRYMALKPGTLTMMQQVLELARLNRDFTFMLQWTGGRGGGHHSGEDFHLPLLAMYPEIRKHPNVILIVGSGFGDADGSWPYLSGTWSLEFGRPKMPVDAVLMGSRCMVAAEAATSKGVKEMIVRCAGVEDKDWEKTYLETGAGGIISLKSELGEPIHKLLNKGMACWREFDEKYFSLKFGSPEAEAKIMKDKDYIIKRLNEAFQKVYFGEKADGRVVDLEEMTYAEVLSRAVRLMYVVDGGDGAAGRFAPNRWIDVTYKTRVFTLMQRFERRLRNTNPSAEAVVTQVSILDEKPWEVVEKFAETYPDAKTILMGNEDIAFFINLCKDLRNGKPVNFVPVIDKELVVWFKRDSLWVSEQVDATIDKDPERVCTLHGPVAVKHSMKVDEPIKDILGNIHSGYVKLAGSTDTKEVECFAEVVNAGSLESLVGSPGTEWVSVVMGSDIVVSDKTCKPNPIPRVMQARPDHSFQLVWSKDGKLATGVQQCNEEGAVIAELCYSTQGKDNQVELVLYDPCPGTAESRAKSQALRFVFNYFPNSCFCPLRELAAGTGLSREETILEYYKQIWMDPALHGQQFSIKDTFSSWFTVSDKDIVAFNRAICRQDDDFAGPHRKNRVSTVDFSTVVGWKPLIQALFAKEIGGDLLKLVHMSHEYKILTEDEQVVVSQTFKGPSPGRCESRNVLTQSSQALADAGGDDDDDFFSDDDLMDAEDLTLPEVVTANGGGAIQASQRIYTEGKIQSIEILPSGKKVSVKAVVFLPSTAAGMSRRNMSSSSVTNMRDVASNSQKRVEPWVEISSSFLIRGDFPYSDTNFTRRSEQWEVQVDAENMQPLLHQKWLSLAGNTKLVAGDLLRFNVDIFESKKSATHFSVVECSGKVTRKTFDADTAEGLWPTIGTVNFEAKGGASENPVSSYLQSVGVSLNEATTLESSYTLMEKPHVQQAPSDCTAYASASRDLNPIHRNNYIAEFVDLPHGSPIVHGMWTCAMARGVLEDVMLPLAGPIRTFGVEFLGMVFPGETLVTQLSHVGVVSGRWIIQVDVCKSGSGEAVLKGRAEVEQPRTAYVFTGQGSAVVGMGMDRYNASPVARKVWDTADKYFKETYGFSILEIVQKNPKEMTIHFGGPLGKRIRDNYMAMTAHNPATGKEQQLIKEIQPNTKSFTFKSPEGLLFATQFSQPALVLVQKAAFEMLRVGGYVPEESMWAGHSLGEYAALSSFSSVLSIEALVETVFLRGMVMQEAVERDSTGRSNYGMVAANPYRVGQGLFTHQMLSQIVEGMEKLTDGKLLQIVNYNVRNFQYVIAGELMMLDALGQVLTSIRTQLVALNAGQREAQPDDKEVFEMIKTALMASDKKQEACKAAGKPFTLERGAATIPLAGIDVPFHSKQLLGGVGVFRRVLTPRLSMGAMQEALPLLVGRYIPNVIAEPFSLKRAYIEQVLKLTESKALEELLEKFDSTADTQKAHTLLIELLAHQFAMPVQWIDTQDVMFMAGTQRLIEMGPAPTLVNMAKQMHKTNVYKEDGNLQVEFLSVTSNEDDIFFKLQSNGPAAKESASELPATGDVNVASPEEGSSDEAPAEAAPAAAPAPAPAAAPAPAPAPTPAPTPAPAPAAGGGGGGGVGGGPNVPPTALHTLKVMIALKLSMPLDQIQDSATIKDLSKGRSAIQNEMVGDLGAEFGSGALPEGAAEMALSAVAEKISSSYSGLGKFTNTAIGKLLGAKMPGGFSASAAKDYLSTELALQPGTVDSVLVHSLAMQPAKRLGSVDEAKSFFSEVTTSFGKSAGVSFEKSSGGGGGGGMMMPMMMMGGGGGGGGPPPPPDAPPSAVHAIKVLVMMKLRKESLQQIAGTETIKSLSGGRSAVQNEVVGDLISEFNVSGGGADGVAEMSLDDLGAKLGGSYSDLGKITTGAVNKMVAQKLPGGFSTLNQVKQYLADVRMLGPGRVASVLLQALTMQPEARFGKDDEAKEWLDKVTDAYASFAGISIPHANKGGGGGGGGGGMMMMGGMITEDSVKKAMKNHHEALARFFKNSLNACTEYLEEENMYDGGLEGVVPHATLQSEATLRSKVEQEVDKLYSELGEDFCTGIQPQHDAKKIRTYDSYWNWVVTDALDVKKIASNERTFCNRATPELLEVLEYLAKQPACSVEQTKKYQSLATQIKSFIRKAPVYAGDNMITTAPSVKVEDSGKINYQEVERTGVKVPSEYVEEMSRGLPFDKSGTLEAAANPSQSVTLQNRDDAFDFKTEEQQQQQQEQEPLKRRCQSTSSLQNEGEAEKPWSFEDEYDSIKVAKEIPHLHLRTASTVDSTMRVFDAALTSQYLSCMHSMATKGVSFAGQVALVTGAGDGSIGLEIVKALLQGGATVIVATRIQRSEEHLMKLYGMYQEIYQEFGSKDAKMILEPCNCSSAQDIKAIVNHVYETLGYDLDFVVPFAAAPENGRDISRIDARSEEAHRMMLTNLVRLLGAVKTAKQERGIDTRPAMVLLPCSPNHGVFGNDGLYAESKLGCESLLNKWESEGWQDYLSLAAAVIGWTRSRLMFQNNIVAPGVEEKGCRTFHTTEMAFNLVALLHPYMTTLAAEAPLWVYLTGNWHKIENLKQATIDMRMSIMNESALKKSLAATTPASKAPAAAQAPLANPLKMYQQFPRLPEQTNMPNWKEVQQKLRGAVDLRQIVVVAGFGEVGPFGGARTRWEIESTGTFSMEGCIQLAWLLGMIVPHNGPLKSNPGKFHIGWMDAATGEPVEDHMVKAKYEEYILQHTGIRIVEPELFEGYDPDKKRMLHYVAIDANVKPIEVSSEEEAREIQRELGEENATVFPNFSGSWFIKLRKGASIAVPRALKFNRFVAGQIPTGWDAKRLGVPADIADSVDPLTLFALVATVEAFVASGVTDPYEFYQYVHVTEVGNTSGSGMGGMRAMKRMFYDRTIESEIPSDTLAESFINTMPAWINMLLLSSSGPIKTPVGACATAAESVEIGVDTIVSGKARVVLAGGHDDFGETGSYEFAQMGATCNSVEDAAKGRFPKEASRPMSDSRAGFVESHGSGIQLLMDAELAIEMGVPIYGVIGLTNTATDKEGRSIPAPGRGILTTAREVNTFSDPSIPPSMLLDFDYRKGQLDSELEQVASWEAKQVQQLESAQSDSADLKMRVDMVHEVAKKKRQAAYNTWGQGFFKCLPNIAPLRGALAVWGLTADDIGVGSFHGTSTKLNDKNESGVVNKQMEHLGRTKGNKMFVVAQKYLTGHPKGAAAAWMLNGMLQCLNDNIVPGNRNLDNVSPELRKFDYLVYPNQSVNVPFVKAALLKSFGFGQAGAEILVIHPNFLLATLEQKDLDRYIGLRRNRENSTYRYQQDVFAGKHGLVQVKSRAPYTEAQEESVYLDPSARAAYSKEVGTWVFSTSSASAPSKSKGASTKSSTEPSAEQASSKKSQPASPLASALEKQAQELTSGKNMVSGVALQDVSPFRKADADKAAFTQAELEYCQRAMDPAASFAGRRAAKDAVLKALASSSCKAETEASRIPLDTIEVLPSSSGAPIVTLHGAARRFVESLGFQTVHISISHSEGLAVCQAVAQK